MKTVIRRAETRDIPSVMLLLNEVNELHRQSRPDIFRSGTKYSADELRDIFADEERPVFVAVSAEDDDFGDDVFGYVFLIVEHQGGGNRAEIKTLYIDDLCVDMARRRLGIGTALFERAVEYAKETGCYNVTLNVWRGNSDALAFYEALGMRPMKICMEKLASPSGGADGTAS